MKTGYTSKAHTTVVSLNLMLRLHKNKYLSQKEVRDFLYSNLEASSIFVLTHVRKRPRCSVWQRMVYAMQGHVYYSSLDIELHLDPYRETRENFKINLYQSGKYKKPSTSIFTYSP